MLSIKLRLVDCALRRRVRPLLKRRSGLRGWRRSFCCLGVHPLSWADQEAAAFFPKQPLPTTVAKDMMVGVDDQCLPSFSLVCVCVCVQAKKEETEREASPIYWMKIVQPRISKRFDALVPTCPPFHSLPSSPSSFSPKSKEKPTHTLIWSANALSHWPADDRLQIIGPANQLSPPIWASKAQSHKLILVYTQVDCENI